MKPETAHPGRIRWLVSSDMPKVVAIEQRSFEDPWPASEFVRNLRQRNCVGLVLVREKEVVAYMVYELRKMRIRILNFAVEPEWRRHGMGSQMVDHLVSKLFQKRKRQLTLTVRETNVSAQLFLQSQGFRAISVLRAFFDDTAEDAYVMSYLDHLDKFTLTNRIKDFL